MKKNQHFKFGLILLLIAAFSNHVPAQMKTEKKESKAAVWEMQVAGVAEIYGLQGNTKAKLFKAYVNMRQDVDKQNSGIIKKDDPKAYTENVTKNEMNGKEQIKSDINKILDGEQAEEALLMLGSFNLRWDNYQKVLLDFDLSSEKLATLSKALAEYMKEYLKARKIARDAGDRFSGRTATELKSNLDKTMASFLNEEEMVKWAMETQRKKKSE